MFLHGTKLASIQLELPALAVAKWSLHLRGYSLGSAWAKTELLEAD